MSATSSPVQDAEAAAIVAHAGELCIRAAAVLATLSDTQREAVRTVTRGRLTGALREALRAACEAAPQLHDSLSTHPPEGFEQLDV